ncbi:MAG: DUF1893 domain-containing protein [Clostridium sp.]|nr:DUF1893 domain-containing protein [Clostridium sp.]
MMDHLIKILHNGGHSLVADHDKIRTFDGRGVSDLYHLLMNDSRFLQGAEVADKVVGKGAAALMIIGGVNALYADVISTPALKLLHESSIKVNFGKQVDHIINRKGDGICPVEMLCLHCATAQECLPLIENFMKTKQK